MGRDFRRQRHRQLASHSLARPAAARLRRGPRRFITTGLAHAASFRPYWGPYAASKAALEALARTYAEETKNITPVRVMLVNPGPMRTKMRAKAMPGEDPKILKTPEEIAPRIAALCTPEWTETGKLYDFPQDRVLHFSDPA